MGIFGAAARHHLFKLTAYCLVVKKARGQKEFLRQEAFLCSEVGYYTFLGWQPFTVGSSKMQMFILDISIGDHCPFSCCACAETTSK